MDSTYVDCSAYDNYDAYEVSNEDKSYYTYMGVSDIFDYHNSIINGKGIIKPFSLCLLFANLSTKSA